jgi:hypothetical protein
MSLSFTDISLSFTDISLSFIDMSLSSAWNESRHRLARKKFLGPVKNESLAQFQLHTYTKITLKNPTPVRLVKEWILMLLIKKTINLKTVYILVLISDVFFSLKKCRKIFGPPLCHLGQWLIFYWPQKFFSGQPMAALISGTAKWHINKAKWYISKKY